MIKRQLLFMKKAAAFNKIMYLVQIWIYTKKVDTNIHYLLQ